MCLIFVIQSLALPFSLQVPWLIVVHVPWCKACMEAVPVVEKVAAENPSARIGLVDATVNTGLLQARSCVLLEDSRILLARPCV